MIQPGSTIGIIGGGQLGRMMALAAANLGYKVHIFTPGPDSPASHVAYQTTIADYDNLHALKAFAEAVAVITFEFENIPPASLEILLQHKPVFPSPAILKTTRNRIREKQFVRQQGIGTAPFMAVTTIGELEEAVRTIGLPAILKTTEMGYDGKGQVILRQEKEAIPAWESLAASEAILEGFVDFIMEISVIVARDAHKNMLCYTPVHNIHKNHILDTTIAPAPLSATLAAQADTIALTLADALDLRGLLAVEMFVTRDEKILVNELAPRPHNSGHWTMDAAVTSQFEQSIRAICGLPLGSTGLLYPAEMKNLIGEEVTNWSTYLENPNAKLHLYGKSDIRKGRKMGHVNILKLGLSNKAIQPFSE